LGSGFSPGEEIVDAVKAACDGVGAHGSVILAPVPAAFRQGVDMLRPMGTAVGISLPPGDFPVDIFSLILHRKTVRGSIVGTRKDLNECLTICSDGKIVCTVEERKLEDSWLSCCGRVGLRERRYWLKCTLPKDFCGGRSARSYIYTYIYIHIHIRIHVPLETTANVEWDCKHEGCLLNRTWNRIAY